MCCEMLWKKRKERETESYMLRNVRVMLKLFDISINVGSGSGECLLFWLRFRVVVGCGSAWELWNWRNWGRFAQITKSNTDIEFILFTKKNYFSCKIKCLKKNWWTFWCKYQLFTFLRIGSCIKYDVQALTKKLKFSRKNFVNIYLICYL